MNVFITGMSSGIGAALAEVLVARGHAVWGIARREALMQQLAARLKSPLVRFSVADVRDENDIRRVATTMADDGFAPDAVVLNAGCYEPDVTEGVYLPEAAGRVWQTNLTGSLAVLAVLLPGMCARGAGQWVAVSSLAAFRPDPCSSAYPASKAALAMTFRSLRLQFENSGLLFKTVYLGPVATDVIPRYRGAKHPPHVVSAEQAAQAIARALVSPKAEFYFPRALSFVYRAMLWIPDGSFERLVRGMRR
jgi:short-subunit dehydrogenase